MSFYGQVGDTWWMKDLHCVHNNKEAGKKGTDFI
jgi:hypothetical protein